tara:strand:+ start:88 stop:417 length:330 start_codon:yes stop_codon:yes gene_type:complete
MKTAIYIVKLLNDPVGDQPPQGAAIFRYKKNALASYEAFAKSIVSGSTGAGEVQLLKYTFMGSPQTVVAKALEIGSVLSCGEYITADPFCDGEWDVDLLQTNGREVGAK